MVNLKNLLDTVTEKATYEPDIGAVMEYVEEVKKLKGSKLRNAIADLRKKIAEGNQYSVCLALEVTDFVMKNCSIDVRHEILSREFLSALKNIVIESTNDRAVNRVLELLAEWKSAFGGESEYSGVSEVCSELSQMGIFMPQVQISAASYLEKPPKWMEAQRCCQCRSEFGKIIGKGRHHCRNCGKSFCHDCSNKTHPLPRFGIEEPVRVCNLCYIQLKRGDIGSSGVGSYSARNEGLPQEYLNSALARESQTSTRTSSDQLKEQEELELAIAMSLNEQENKQVKQSSSKPTPKPVQVSSRHQPEPQPTQYASISYGEIPEDDVSDSALSKYLDRNYWEQRKKQQGDAVSVQPSSDIGPPPVAASLTPVGRQDIPIISSIKNTLDMFVKRMQEVNAAGRSIATDISVQSMFQTLTAMHPQLLRELERLDEEKAKQQDVLKKLDDVKEARVSLDAMRRQHQDKLKQQQEEMMMLARMQVEQKRALMQQLKAEESAFQDLLRQRRQEEMSVQQSLYQQQLHHQKEMETQMRQAYEQQLLEKQFGSLVVGTGTQESYQAIHGLNQSNPVGPPLYQEPSSTLAQPPYQPSLDKVGMTGQLASLQPPGFQPAQPLQQLPSSQPSSFQQPFSFGQPSSFQPTMQPPPPSFQQPQVLQGPSAVPSPGGQYLPQFGVNRDTSTAMPRSDRSMSQKSVELISFD